MKENPSIGSKILGVIKSIPNLTDGVKYHHERYDGLGYPSGLKGENIPLIGRIISCADAYDAMSSTRCYRKNLSNEELIAQFKKGSGNQFDPKIATIVIKLIENNKMIA